MILKSFWFYHCNFSGLIQSNLEYPQCHAQEQHSKHLCQKSTDICRINFSMLKKMLNLCSFLIIFAKAYHILIKTPREFLLWLSGNELEDSHLIPDISGLRIWRCHELWVGHKWGSDLAFLWLWWRPEAAALIRPLAWVPPYAMGTVLKDRNKQTTSPIRYLLHKQCHLMRKCWYK